MKSLTAPAFAEHGFDRSGWRQRLAERRRRIERTLKQASLVLVVFALGGAAYVMKWTGMLVL